MALASYRLEALTVEIVEGSIASPGRTFDALVSSDDNYLSHSGGVSAALWEAAGPTFRPFDGRERPRLSLGSTCLTHAGNLPARHLIHAITVDFDENRQITPPHLPALYASVFRTAGESGCESIAVPLLGAGAAGAGGLSAVAFAESARNANSEGLCLVAVYLLPKDFKPLTTVIERELRDSSEDAKWAIAAALKALPLQRWGPLNEWLNLKDGRKQRAAMANLLASLVGECHVHLEQTPVWDQHAEKTRASLAELRMLHSQVLRSQGPPMPAEVSAAKIAILALVRSLLAKDPSTVALAPSTGRWLPSRGKAAGAFARPDVGHLGPDRQPGSNTHPLRVEPRISPHPQAAPPPSRPSDVPSPPRGSPALGEPRHTAEIPAPRESAPIPSIRPDLEGGTGAVRALHRLIVERLPHESLSRIYSRLERSGYRGDPDFRLLEHLVQAEDLLSVVCETFDLAMLEAILEGYGVVAEQPLPHRASAARLLSVLGFQPPRRARGLHAAQTAVADAKARLRLMRSGDPAIRGTVLGISAWLECLCQALLRFVGLAVFDRPPEVLLRDMGALPQHVVLARTGLGQLFGLIDALSDRIVRESTPQLALLHLSQRPLLPLHGKGQLPTTRNDFAHRNVGSDAANRAEGFLKGAAALLNYLAEPEERIFPRILVVTGIHYDRWGRRLVEAEPEDGGMETIFSDAVLRPGEIYFMHPRSNPIRVDPLLIPAGDFSFPESA